MFFSTLAEMAAFSVVTVALRLSTEDISIFQTTFIRYAICALLIAPLSLLRGALYTNDDIKIHLRRSIFIYVSALSWTYAITSIPLSLALFIFYLKTILLCLLSSHIGYGAPSRTEWFAVSVGIVGVLLVVGPLPASSSPLGMAAAFLSAVSSSLIASETKRLGTTGTPTSATLMAMIMVAVISFPASTYYWISPSYNTMTFITVSSIFTVISQCILFYSYSRLSITKIALIEFGRFLCLSLIGALVFYDRLNSVAIFGLALIAGCIAVGLLASPGKKSLSASAPRGYLVSASSRATSLFLWKRNRRGRET
ncbi:DMT family transporter [Mesorhizobium sp. NPDC059054]|uniref:DMT family transporter n=1 Tax=Mesorhizobium sp. NPDC059054 TaxID=3346711 RepID=UPI0036A9EFCF